MQYTNYTFLVLTFQSNVISILRNYLKYIHVNTIYYLLYTKSTEYLGILQIHLILYTLKKCQTF